MNTGQIFEGISPGTELETFGQQLAGCTMKTNPKKSSVVPLSPSEEAALARRARKGDDVAREKLITAHLPLVARIARAYQGFGLSLGDLISEGNIGLMRAVDRFDPDKGARLATYGGIWINQTIRRAIGNQGRTVRLPVHVVERIIRMREIESRLEEELKRTPTDAELATEMNLQPARVAHLRSAALRITSLDVPLEEGGQRLVDIITDDRSSWTPAHEAERQTSADALAELFESLKPRERLVLRRRFGLMGAAEHTLDAIGKKLGLTRERVRQIENGALKKLRKKLAERDALETIVMARPRKAPTKTKGRRAKKSRS